MAELYYDGDGNFCGFKWKNSKLKAMEVKHDMPVDLNHKISEVN